MGYTVSFVPNVSYNAASFNAIGGDFSATENPTFVDGQTYGVKDLNKIRSDMATAGIFKNVGRSCACSISGSSIKIASGRVLFNNGVRAEIDNDGITTVYTPKSKGYVWLKYDDSLCEMSLEYTTTQPNGDFVEIAKIRNDTVEDCRQYSYMKNASLLPNKVVSFSNVSIILDINEFQTKPAHVVTLDDAGYQYMLVSNTDSHCDFLALVDFQAMTLHSQISRFSYGRAFTDYEKGFCTYITEHGDGAFVKAVKKSNKVEFFVTENRPGINASNINLMFF